MRGHARSNSVMTSRNHARWQWWWFQPPAYTQASSKVLPCLSMVPLGQTVDPAVPGFGLTADIDKSRGSCQNASRLTVAIASPLRLGVSASAQQLSPRPVCAGGDSLDDEGESRAPAFWLARLFLHQLKEQKASICAQQQRCRHKAGCHRQGALKVVFTLGLQMLHTRAQS